MNNSTIKQSFAECVECVRENDDHSSKLLGNKSKKLCVYHNKRRLYHEAKGRTTKKKKARRIAHMSPKRARVEAKIRRGKRRLKRRHVEQFGSLEICASCLTVGQACGASHTISVNDCLNDPDIPDRLAWSSLNMTWECHTGENCHAVTEAKKENSFKAKFNQESFWRKAIILKKHKRSFYDFMIESLRIDSQDANERLDIEREKINHFKIQNDEQ